MMHSSMMSSPSPPAPVPSPTLASLLHRYVRERKSTQQLMNVPDTLKPAAYREEIMYKKRTKAYISLLSAEQQSSLDSVFSVAPTRAVYVCGIGASNGVNYTQCHQLLSTFGTIERLIMTGLVQFVLVVYHDVHHAQAAYEMLDGKAFQVDEQNQRVMFTEYAVLQTSRFFQLSAEQIADVEDNPLQLSCAMPLQQYAPENCCHSTQLATTLANPARIHAGRINGLLLVEEFVSVDEERMLLQYFDSHDWQSIKLRSVQHYGYEFQYGKNDIDRQRPLAAEGRGMPEFLSSILSRMSILGRLQDHCDISSHQHAENAEMCDFNPDQLTVNKYVPGSGIPHHVDTHSAFTDLIVSISLGSLVVMDFKSPVLSPRHASPYSNAQQHEASVHHVPLPARSLLCLSGRARYGFTHAITPRRTDNINHALHHRGVRVSMTFRQIRAIHTGAVRPTCHCAYTQLCDTAQDTSSTQQQNSTNSSSSSTLLPAIIQLHADACAKQQDTYTDPSTGYSVFTEIGLRKIRKGVCCGNKCRHCPYNHINVPKK